MELAVRVALIGIGATVVMDLWVLLLKRIFGIAALDYATVGRWLGHMPAGRFAHTRMAAVSAVRGERILGWTAHYTIGVAFAFLLLAVAGEGWVREPTLLPAMAVGIGTVIAPFLVMQPAMGLGFAASKTAKPIAARLRSLLTHTVFGVGLYAAAWVLALLASL